MKNGKITSCVKECSDYDKSLRQCSIGRIKPPTIKGGLDAVRTYRMLHGGIEFNYCCPRTYTGAKIKEILVAEAKEKVLEKTYRQELESMGESINDLKRRLNNA